MITLARNPRFTTDRAAAAAIPALPTMFDRKHVFATLARRFAFMTFRAARTALRQFDVSARLRPRPDLMVHLRGRIDVINFKPIP